MDREKNQNCHKQVLHALASHNLFMYCPGTFSIYLFTFICIFYFIIIQKKILKMEFRMGRITVFQPRAQILLASSKKIFILSRGKKRQSFSSGEGGGGWVCG